MSNINLSMSLFLRFFLDRLTISVRCLNCLGQSPALSACAAQFEQWTSNSGSWSRTVIHLKILYVDVESFLLYFILWAAFFVVVIIIICSSSSSSNGSGTSSSSSGGSSNSSGSSSSSYRVVTFSNWMKSYYTIYKALILKFSKCPYHFLGQEQQETRTRDTSECGPVCHLSVSFPFSVTSLALYVSCKCVSVLSQQCGNVCQQWGSIWVNLTYDVVNI